MFSLTLNRCFLLLTLLFSFQIFAEVVNRGSLWTSSIEKLNEALLQNDSNQQLALAEESAKAFGAYLVQQVNELLKVEGDGGKDLELAVVEYATLASKLPASVQSAQMMLVKEQLRTIRLPDLVQDFKHRRWFQEHFAELSLDYKAQVLPVAFPTYVLAMYFSYDPLLSTLGAITFLAATEIFYVGARSVEAVLDINKPKLEPWMPTNIKRLQEVLDGASQETWGDCASLLVPSTSGGVFEKLLL